MTELLEKYLKKQIAYNKKLSAKLDREYAKRQTELEKLYPPKKYAKAGPQKIGFWYSNREPNLPKPQDFVDEHWDPGERAMVILYLSKAPISMEYDGFSSCRFGDKPCNGGDDLSDGTYTWPSGYVHYLEMHNVKPSQEFIEHVRKMLIKQEIANGNMHMADLEGIRELFSK